MIEREYHPTQCWGEGVVNRVITVLTLTVKVIYQHKRVHSGITELPFGAYKLLRKPQASPIVNKGGELYGERGGGWEGLFSRKAQVQRDNGVFSGWVAAMVDFLKEMQ